MFGYIKLNKIDGSSTSSVEQQSTSTWSVAQMELLSQETVAKLVFFCECECESVEHVLWECSEYSSIRKKFIRNLDDLHLKSLSDKTKYIFDQSIWECNGHFDDWFSNTKAFFCVAYGICAGRNFIHQVHLI